MTPNSTALGSSVRGRAVKELFQIEQGQVRGPTFDRTWRRGVSMLPLSSVARALIVALPVAPGVQE